MIRVQPRAGRERAVVPEARLADHLRPDERGGERTAEEAVHGERIQCGSTSSDFGHIDLRDLTPETDPVTIRSILKQIWRRDLAILEATQLWKRYKLGEHPVNALAGVDFAVERGDFVAIMGPSGSGKSTLLHLLGGLDRPSDGEIALAGLRLSVLDDDRATLARRHNVGFVFQFYNLLPTLTAEENITLPLSIAGEKPDAGWLRTLIDAVGLGDRTTHRPAELSGGQQQRVAVARSLLARPSVVFADEPTGNLDSSASHEVLALLRRAVDEFGQTVVMVTHEAQAAAIADRVVFLADGEIVRDEGHLEAGQVLDTLKALGS